MRLSISALTLVLAIPGLALAQTPPPPRPGLAPAAPAPAPAAEPAPAPAPAPVAEVAAPVPVPEPAPAPEAAPAASGITWTTEGLVDAYYMYNFTGDPKTQGPSFRNFDTNANSFTLNYLKFAAQADSDVFSLRADVGAGHTAALINGSSQGLSGTPEGDMLYGNGLFIQQAFATLKISPELTLDFGRFVTNAGGEVIEANKNYLYSRSMLFYGIPLLHTGVRVGYQASDMLKVQASLVNGWNNDPDNNSDKTYGLSFFLTPPDTGINAALNTYFGKEGGSDTTMLVDLVFSKDMEGLSLAANVDYFKLGEAYWTGLSAMGKFLVSDTFNLAARAEYIMSKKGGFGIDGDASLYEVTVQGAYTMGSNYELRAEIRFDGSDKELFVKGLEAKKNQATGLVAALAYF